MWGSPILVENKRRGRKFFPLNDREVTHIEAHFPLNLEASALLPRSVSEENRNRHSAPGRSRDASQFSSLTLRGKRGAPLPNGKNLTPAVNL